MGVTLKKPLSPKKRTAPKKQRVASPAGQDLIANIDQWSTGEKIGIIEAGISKSQFEEVKKQSGLDYETLSHILLVTKATLHNKKGNEKFNASVSERLLMLAEIYAYGIETLGEKEKFNKWLVSGIVALDGKRPVDRLNTLLGMQEVKQIIGRIAYGVYS